MTVIGVLLAVAALQLPARNTVPDSLEVGKAFITSPTSLLQGRVSGVHVSSTDGNINGLEVMKDGKYIIENKIIIVKNGVKYDANGKKLN